MYRSVQERTLASLASRPAPRSLGLLDDSPDHRLVLSRRWPKQRRGRAARPASRPANRARRLAHSASLCRAPGSAPLQPSGGFAPGERSCGYGPCTASVTSALDLRVPRCSRVPLRRGPRATGLWTVPLTSSDPVRSDEAGPRRGVRPTAARPRPARASSCGPRRSSTCRAPHRDAMNLCRQPSALAPPIVAVSRHHRTRAASWARKVRASAIQASSLRSEMRRA